VKYLFLLIKCQINVSQTSYYLIDTSCI